MQKINFSWYQITTKDIIPLFRSLKFKLFLRLHSIRGFCEPSHPPLLPIPDRPVEIRGPPRLLVTDRHQPERVGGVAGPVVLGSEADVARLVLALVIEADRVAAGLGRRLIPPELRAEPAQRFDAHHGGAPALVFHRRLDVE